MPDNFLDYYSRFVYPNICLKELKPVKPENCHITLKFLGETQTETVPEICRAVENTLKGERIFSIKLSEFGCFPCIKKAQVLWLSFTDTDNGLKRIAEKINCSLENFGYKKEKRPFRPHMTIARVRRNAGSRNFESIKNEFLKKMYNDYIKIDIITFFESILTPDGPVYKVLYKIPLG